MPQPFTSQVGETYISSGGRSPAPRVYTTLPPSRPVHLLLAAAVGWVLRADSHGRQSLERWLYYTLAHLPWLNGGEWQGVTCTLCADSFPHTVVKFTLCTLINISAVHVYVHVYIAVHVYVHVYIHSVCIYSEGQKSRLFLNFAAAKIFTALHTLSLLYIHCIETVVCIVCCILHHCHSYLLLCCIVFFPALTIVIKSLLSSLSLSLSVFCSTSP